MIGSLHRARGARTQSPRGGFRYAGVAAGPAESGSALTTSTAYLAEIGQRFEVVARVAGTTPLRSSDPAGIVRHCLRTVDTGLALCCLLPTTEHLRLGSVIRLSGTIVGQRTRGDNRITEITITEAHEIG